MRGAASKISIVPTAIPLYTTFDDYPVVIEQNLPYESSTKASTELTSEITYDLKKKTKIIEFLSLLSFFCACLKLFFSRHFNSYKSPSGFMRNLMDLIPLIQSLPL